MNRADAEQMIYEELVYAPELDKNDLTQVAAKIVKALLEGGWTAPVRMNKFELRKLSSFVYARIEENPDGGLIEQWDNAHEQIDISARPSEPRFLPGEVKDEEALRSLAQRWRDHPDFRQEWA